MWNRTSNSNACPVMVYASDLGGKTTSLSVGNLNGKSILTDSSKKSPISVLYLMCLEMPSFLGCFRKKSRELISTILMLGTSNRLNRVYSMYQQIDSDKLEGIIRNPFAFYFPIQRGCSGPIQTLRFVLLNNFQTWITIKSFAFAWGALSNDSFFRIFHLLFKMGNSIV